MDPATALPVFDVDLDTDPAERWRGVAEAYAPALQKLAEWQQSLAEAPSTRRKGRRRRKEDPERRIARYAASEALRLLQQSSEGGVLGDFLAELRGVASAAAVPLTALASLTLQYEAYCACTAVAARMADGSVALARTLDWEFPELKALNIDVRVHRAGRLLYTATTWAGYIGLLTAQRSGAYAVAVNFREQGEGTDCGAELPLPVGLAMRQAIEQSESFGDFVRFVAAVPTMAPFYCLVVSASGEAVQITRDAPCGEVARRELEEDSAHLIQANMDHWDSNPANDTQQSLVRCDLAEAMLQAAELDRGAVVEADLWAILWKHPIFEKGCTLYSSVMNPALGTFRSLSEPPEVDGTAVRPTSGKRKKSRK